MAIKINITGFSDNIFDFAKVYTDLLLKCANEMAFLPGDIKNSIEKLRSEYANSNNDVDAKASNNRLLMLIPHTFHDKLVAKELKKQMNKGDDFDFCPGSFLRDRILA